MAVIDTPFVRRQGLHAGPIARWMLGGRRTRRWMRTIYGLNSLALLKRGHVRADVARDYWQAGRSVAGIESIESVEDIVARFHAAAVPPGATRTERENP